MGLCDKVLIRGNRSPRTLCDWGLARRATAAAASMAPRDDPADITAEAALLEAFSEIPTVAGAWVHSAGPNTSTLAVRR